MIRATKAQTTQFLLQKSGLTSTMPSSEVMVRSLVALPVATAAWPFAMARARLADFAPPDLLTPLYQTRRLVQRPGVRNSLHLLHQDDFVTLHIATQRQRRQFFNAEWLKWEIDGAEIEALGQTIIEAVGDGEIAIPQLEATLAPHSHDLTHTGRSGRAQMTTSSALALQWLTAQGQIVCGQAIPPTDWQAEPATIARTSTWYPQIDLTADLSEAEAQLQLVRAYLTAYGPVTEADISAWTGFGKSETQRAVSTLARETTLAMVDGIPGAMLLLKMQADQLKATQPDDAPRIHLLAADDPYIIAHKASRARLFAEAGLAPRLSRQVFNSRDQAKPTILLNGYIVGTWEWNRAEKGDDTLTCSLFSELKEDLISLLEAELAQLALFLQATVEQGS